MCSSFGNQMLMLTHAHADSCSCSPQRTDRPCKTVSRPLEVPRRFLPLRFGSQHRVRFHLFRGNLRPSVGPFPSVAAILPDRSATGLPSSPPVPRLVFSRQDIGMPPGLASRCETERRHLARAASERLVENMMRTGQSGPDKGASCMMI